MRRSALLVAFVVTSSSLVGLSSVTALPAHAAGASLAVSDANPYQGQYVKFTGKLDTPPGTPTEVDLQLAETGWVDIRKVTTTDGTYEFDLGTGSTDTRNFRTTVHNQGIASNTVALKAKSIETLPKIAAPKSSASSPFVNGEFLLTGNIGVAQARNVILQRDSGSSWADTRNMTSKADGSYDFPISTASSSRSWRVYAPAVEFAAPIVSNSVTTDTKSNDIGLVVSRVGSSTQIVADGFLSAGKADGRTVELQYAGNGWIKLATQTQADNKVRFTGLKRSTRYRLVARPYDTSKNGQAPQVVSHDESLSYGPDTLGNNTAYITTQGGTFPKKKGSVYTSTISMNGSKGSLVADVDEFGVRGNTSAFYPKPGYKLKFSDPASPLGLPLGKTFNLVPDYQDRSLVRTAIGIGYVAGHVNIRGGAWTPHRAFMEIYINGSYRGVYDLIESIKIEPGGPDKDGNNIAPRVPIDETTGVIIEIDPFGKEDGVPYWHSSKSDLPFKFKDPDSADDGDGTGFTTAKAKAIKAKVEKFESVLYGSNPYDKTNGWTKYMNMDSAVDWYLCKEFIKDWDGDFYRSNFFYTNNVNDPNSKLVMAPVWDVDRSAGAKTSGTSSVMSPKGWWMNGDGGGHLNNSDNVHTKHWFVKITKDKAFQAALKVRWDQVQGTFKAAGDSQVSAAVAEMGKVAGDNDWKMWSKTGDAKRYQPHTGSFSSETTWVRNWYRDRYSWMNSQLE